MGLTAQRGDALSLFGTQLPEPAAVLPSSLVLDLCGESRGAGGISVPVGEGRGRGGCTVGQGARWPCERSEEGRGAQAWTSGWEGGLGAGRLADVVAGREAAVEGARKRDGSLLFSTLPAARFLVCLRRSEAGD